MISIRLIHVTRTTIAVAKLENSLEVCLFSFFKTPLVVFKLINSHTVNVVSLVGLFP